MRNIAIPLYPRFTALDVVGPYTVLAFAPECKVSFVAAERVPVSDDRGTLSLTANATYAEVSHPDVVLVPGGPGTIEALADQQLIGWLQGVHQHTQWTTSVCSGSFLLAAAGLLPGVRATSHWGWRERLADFGAVPVEERVVFDGRIVTAAGVSAGIDMALALLAELHDPTIAQAVQLAIEYDPQPPFGAGSPATAPAGMTDAALALIR
ncbi:DJ-1/PfpI family protein [Natronosporangium hydrolyticum]|uniref:DJ-1/PfpI family protein n=1 Tax=Natronosporangium hydrolyticum TaxID=2811111 RepID=A0A895YKJ3_9ACTN|nr:DJ-1/PfpI family protein [Natronosporangium hydrolyticum]QSB14620.1 DJ-1/PfpI family protein [Natronosporangium hydrolyticum]